MRRMQTTTLSVPTPLSKVPGLLVMVIINMLKLTLRTCAERCDKMSSKTILCRHKMITTSIRPTSVVLISALVNKIRWIMRKTQS